MVLSGVLAIILLAAAAYLLRQRARHACRPGGSSLPPWALVLAVLGLGFPWDLLMGLIFGSRTTLLFWIPLLAGITWALLALLLIRRWSSVSTFGDPHRWALALGATLVGMGSGLLGSKTWPRVDLAGACVFDVLALTGYAWLARRVRARKPLAGN